MLVSTSRLIHIRSILLAIMVAAAAAADIAHVENASLLWPPCGQAIGTSDKNSSGDEIAKVNFFTTTS